MRKRQTKITLSSMQNDELTISVLPHSTDTSSAIFTSLHAWAEGKRQPTWQWVWMKVSGVQWILFFPFVMISLALLTLSAKQSLKAEARQLLQRGLTKEDDHRAIELLLSIASDYNKSTEATSSLTLPPRWFIICFIFSLLACIALSFPVNTAVGIGKGKKSLAWRRMWLSSLYGVFILFFVVAVGGSFLAAMLYEYVTK